MWIKFLLLITHYSNSSLSMYYSGTLCYCIAAQRSQSVSCCPALRPYGHLLTAALQVCPIAA